MKITVAIDSMKGSLTSLEAGRAARRGILKAMPTAEVHVCPLADGGEGTVEALTNGHGGVLRAVKVTGPDGTPVSAAYGILEKEEKTAVIEMAAAAGITLLPPEKRNPLYTTTFGVGELILDAISQGCRRFLIGIGGSATNDGGIGMLSALGYQFLDGTGSPVPPTASGLSMIESISDENVVSQLSQCVFRIACDVQNPLCGPEGCSRIFGPQKGADPETVSKMDEWLQAFSQKVRILRPGADPDAPGAGAAGGLGYAFLNFTNARLEPGAKIIIEETGLEALIRDSDLVVTGEGRLDRQTAMGKAPIAVARTAKKYGKKVIAFSGCVSSDADYLNTAGIDAFFPIIRAAMPLEEALLASTASDNLSAAAQQVFNLIQIIKS